MYERTFFERRGLLGFVKTASVSSVNIRRSGGGRVWGYKIRNARVTLIVKDTYVMLANDERLMSRRLRLARLPTSIAQSNEYY